MKLSHKFIQSTCNPHASLKDWLNFHSRFYPYFGWCVLCMYFIPAKVGIKSCSQCWMVHKELFLVTSSKLVTCLLTFYCDLDLHFQILIFYIHLYTLLVCRLRYTIHTCYCRLQRWVCHCITLIQNGLSQLPNMVLFPVMYSFTAMRLG